MFMRERFLLTTAATAVAATTTLSSAYAGGFSIIEFGTRRTGMATSIAKADDPSSILHNPAGISLLSGTHVYVSGGLAMINTEFSLLPWDQSDKYIDDIQPGADGYYSGVKPTRAMAVLPMLAATYELKPDTWWLGIGAFVGNATGAKFAPDAVTRYHLIEGYIVAPQLSVAATYKPLRNLAVAATAGVINFTIKGNRQLYPILPGSNGGPPTDVHTLIGSNARLQLNGSGWAPTWSIGALYQPTSKISLGAAVLGRIDATLTGDIKVSYGDDAAVPGDTLEGTQKTNQIVPWTFNGGASFDVHPNIEIAADLRYWLYRQYQNQTTNIKGIALIQKLVTIKNYHDSYQVSAGVRVHDLRQAPKLELMFGTHYDRTPAPAQSVTLDQPTFSHIGIHSGVRYNVGNYRIGATYLRYFYDVPTITDSITSPPSNIRGNGVNNTFSLQLEGVFGKGAASKRTVVSEVSK
jgi:long-chain fatty acid transport protein